MELRSKLPLELCEFIMIFRHRMGIKDIQKELLDIQEETDILNIQILEEIMENGGDIQLWTLNQVIFLRKKIQLILNLIN